jgi:hypothetical protein
VTKHKPAVYVAVIGLSLKNDDRVEVGDTYPGRPPKWLITQGKVKERG